MSLKHAILGFLEIEPMTGYRLSKRFASSIDSFWHASLSQIYRDLHQLERKGLVGSKKRKQSSRPDQRLFTITDQGRTELDEWLVQPLTPLTVRDPIILRFSLMANQSQEQMDRLLNEYHELIAARFAVYKSRQETVEHLLLARTSREKKLWQLTLDHGIEWCEMQLSWIKNARKELQVHSRSRRQP